MRILITGGSGFLGQYINISLSRKNDILTLYHSNARNCIRFNSKKTDICSYSSLNEIFKEFKPEVLVHTAAVTASNSNLPSKEVYKINVEAAENLARLCSDQKCRMIYTSTDLVYAGYRGSMLKEDAKLIPVSLYAETKLMGEEKIKRNLDNYLILRTALLYGIGLNNSYSHFSVINNSLRSGKEVKLFTDQFRTPLSVIEAAEMIQQLCEKKIVNDTLNFGGMERVSRFEFGEILCDTAGYNKELLLPVKMNDIPDYPAVEDVSMNTDKLKAVGIKQKSIRESISEILQETYWE